MMKKVFSDQLEEQFDVLCDEFFNLLPQITDQNAYVKCNLVTVSPVPVLLLECKKTQQNGIISHLS